MFRNFRPPQLEWNDKKQTETIDQGKRNWFSTERTRNTSNIKSKRNTRDFSAEAMNSRRDNNWPDATHWVGNFQRLKSLNPPSRYDTTSTLITPDDSIKNKEKVNYFNVFA